MLLLPHHCWLCDHLCKPQSGVNDDYLCAGLSVWQVLVNGRPADASLRRLSAYVPQEDAFVPTLSAWETLEVRVTL